MNESVRAHLMLEGLRAFNRREFFEAHEHWEEVWDHLDDPERRWVQGLIQVATGLHKLGQRKVDPCRTLLGRALAKLEDAPDVVGGIDVAGARQGARAILEAVERGELPDPGSLRLRHAGATR